MIVEAVREAIAVVRDVVGLVREVRDDRAKERTTARRDEKLLQRFERTAPHDCVECGHGLHQHADDREGWRCKWHTCTCARYR